MTEDLVRFSKI